jgi:2-oxoglutarate ferredoxin oxidoreductase subunit beta
MITSKDYDCNYENKWCPGCGNFQILAAMKEAFAQQQIPPEKLTLISGIGQAGKTPHFLKCNMFHGLHGRALPLATGTKIANNDLTVVVSCGDGDCYGEGGNHFLAAIRRNLDMTLLVHNNQIYGLTKGQASPTSSLGMVTKLQNNGTPSSQFSALAIALAAGAGFVARGLSGEPEHLTELIVKAMNYKGFALVDILQPCVSFNKINTLSWYKERAYKLDADHDPQDLAKAFQLAQEWENSLPLGVLYESAGTPFHERVPNLKVQSLASHKYDGKVMADTLLKNL